MIDFQYRIILDEYNIKYVFLVARVIEYVSFHCAFDSSEFFWGNVIKKVIHMIYHFYFDEGQKIFVFKN